MDRTPIRSRITQMTSGTPQQFDLSHPTPVPLTPPETNTLLQLHDHLHAARQRPNNRAPVSSVHAQPLVEGNTVCNVTHVNDDERSSCSSCIASEALAQPVPPAQRNTPASSASTDNGGWSASNPLKRTLAYARSLTRLRSTLLSAYACYIWAAEQLKGEGHGGSETLEMIRESAQMVRRNGGANGLASKSSHVALNTLSRISPSQQNVAFARRALRTAFHVWAFYSRRFHRFLRPHLLLLMRSRALGKVLGLVAPALRRNALLLGHAVFVWGSAWMIVKRVTQSATGGDNKLLPPWTLLTPLRNLLAKWKDTRRMWKLICILSSLAGAFTLYTCISIILEHRARRARRLQELELSADHHRPFDQSQLEHHLDRSPEPTPDATPNASRDQSPNISPSASSSDLARMGFQDDPARLLDSDLAAASHAHAPHHPPMFSFHRDCRACIAAAIASSDVAATYAHDHPPTGWDGSSVLSTHQPEMIAPPPRASFVALHPLASQISKRMEWSPSRFPHSGAMAAASHASAPPGTPLGSHAFSFVSPASMRLTSIRISKLRQQTDSIERVRSQLQDNMRAVYEEDLQRRLQLEQVQEQDQHNHQGTESDTLDSNDEDDLEERKSTPASRQADNAVSPSSHTNLPPPTFPATNTANVSLSRSSSSNSPARSAGIIPTLRGLFRTSI